MTRKTPSIDSPTRPTAPAPGETKPKGKTRPPIGVYLKNDVYAVMDEIARDNNVKMHGLIAYAVSYFVRQYRAGKVTLETETKTTLKTDI